MSTFTIDANGGALAAGQGIGNLLKAAALGPLYRQNAQQDAMLKGAQVYHNNMAGNKAGTEAELLALKLGLQRDPLKTVMTEQQVPLDRRDAIESFINTGSFGPSYDTPVDGVGQVQPAPVTPEKMSSIARSIALFNKTLGVGGKVDDMAKAAQIDQEMRAVDAIIKDPKLALPTAQAFFAASGKAPFNNVGNTGSSINALTGNQFEANPALAKLFSDTQNALTNQRNAAAGASGAAANLSNARRDRVEGGLDKLVTILNDDGTATVTAVPTKGDMRTVGTAVPKGTGVDATNAKTRNAIIAAVEKDFPTYTEEQITEEVNKRLARRGISKTGNKNPSPGTSGTKIEENVPAGYKKIGTSNGKPVYQAPDGKKYIME